MPKGPNGQKRPADALGLAVLIGEVVTSEIEEDIELKSADAAVGSEGSKARAVALTR